MLRSWGNSRVISNGPFQTKRPQGVALVWCRDLLLHWLSCQIEVIKVIQFPLVSVEESWSQHSWILVWCMSGWGQDLLLQKRRVKQAPECSLNCWVPGWILWWFNKKTRVPMQVFLGWVYTLSLCLYGLSQAKLTYSKNTKMCTFGSPFTTVINNLDGCWS